MRMTVASMLVRLAAWVTEIASLIRNEESSRVWVSWIQVGNMRGRGFIRSSSWPRVQRVVRIWSLWLVVRLLWASKTPLEGRVPPKPLLRCLGAREETAVHPCGPWPQLSTLSCSRVRTVSRWLPSPVLTELTSMPTRRWRRWIRICRVSSRIGRRVHSRSLGTAVHKQPQSSRRRRRLWRLKLRSRRSIWRNSFRWKITSFRALRPWLSLWTPTARTSKLLPYYRLEKRKQEVPLTGSEVVCFTKSSTLLVRITTGSKADAWQDKMLSTAHPCTTTYSRRPLSISPQAVWHLRSGASGAFRKANRIVKVARKWLSLIRGKASLVMRTKSIKKCLQNTISRDHQSSRRKEALRYLGIHPQMPSTRSILFRLWSTKTLIWKTMALPVS